MRTRFSIWVFLVAAFVSCAPERQQPGRLASPTPAPNLSPSPVPAEERRTDARIKSDVDTALAAESLLSASRITSAVREGVVTLSGSVPSTRSNALIRSVTMIVRRPSGAL